jgi:hypothetical protein
MRFYLPNQRFARVAVSAAMVFLCAAQIYAAFPGYLTHDSAYQWLQARTGEITSLWPPGSVYLLKLFDAIWVGPHGVFVLQIVFFWIGAIALVRQSRNALCTSGVGLLFMVAPTMWICIPHVWSDVQLTSSLVAVCALCLGAAKSESERARFWIAGTAIVLLMCSTLLRYNALVACVPLFFIAFRCFSPNAPRLLAIVGAAVSPVIAAIFVSLHVNAVSTVRADNFALTQIWDLQAVSIATNKNLIPAEIASDTSIEDLRSNFAPTHALKIYDGSKATWVNAAMGLTSSQRGVLRKAWLMAILNHPSAYVNHRAAIMLAMLGRKTNPQVDGIADERIRHKLQDNPAFEMKQSKMLTKWHKWSDFLKSSYWATPLIWIGALTIVLIAILLRIEPASMTAKSFSLEAEAALAVALSGVLYLSSFVVTAPAADLRYALWPTIAAIAALACALSSTQSCAIKTPLPP